MTKPKSQQIADLRAERERIGTEIAALRDRLTALERRGMAIGSKILHLEMSGRNRIGQPTLSNAIIRRVWEQLVRLTWDGGGVPSEDLYRALRCEIPSLRPGTLRVYLYRFKDKGLLEKRGSAWHRTATDARLKAKENRPLPTAGFSGAEAPLVIADTDTLASPSISVNDPRLGGSFLQAQKEAS